MYGSKDITSDYERVAGRFAGNTFEQSPFFLWGLWLYTLFVDSGSAYTVGMVYLFFRVIYPLNYIICRSFSFWFEFNTQSGYGCNGVFILGCAMTGLGIDFVAFLTASPIKAALFCYATGSFAFFPGLPLMPIYSFLWYKRDNAVAKGGKSMM